MIRVLKLGLRGDDVLQWQMFLHREGFEAGNTRGDFGANIEPAIELFQCRSKSHQEVHFLDLGT